MSNPNFLNYFPLSSKSFIFAAAKPIACFSFFMNAFFEYFIGYLGWLGNEYLWLSSVDTSTND